MDRAETVPVALSAAMLRGINHGNHVVIWAAAKSGCVVHLPLPPDREFNTYRCRERSKRTLLS
jgi:hypothetical protein